MLNAKWCFMASWTERACTALTVYLERGFRALELIRQEAWEEADAMLNMRRAAFHNFRAADHLALKEGYSAEQDVQLREIWTQITSLDDELVKEMKEAQRKMESEMVRLSKVKNALGRYKSGNTVDANIVKSV
jgi:hypothetical protein